MARRDPWLAVLPLLAALLFATIGAAGVVAAARATSGSARKAALGFAESGAAAVTLQMALHASTLQALQEAIANQPEPADIPKWFPAAAKRMLLQARRPARPPPTCGRGARRLGGESGAPSLC
jgi:hypothetical protein